MIICTRCKTENNDGVNFCVECGNNLSINVDTPASEELRSLADMLNEQAVNTRPQPFNLFKAISDLPKKTGNFFKGIYQKIGKKRLIVISSSIVALVICIIFTVNYIIPFAPHYFKGNSALEAADYATAISEYELAGNFLNSKAKLNDAHYLYAEKLFRDQNFYDAAAHYDLVLNYEDAESKLIQCGTNLLEDKEYKKSVEVLEMVTSNEVSQLKDYASGMNELTEGNFEVAKEKFVSAGEYKDSKVMINACDLMIAEDYCKNGKFDAAKRIYSSLPEDFVYNGISALGRLSLLNNSQTLINAMGTWAASDNYIETKNVYKRTGSWDNWYYGHDNVLSGQKITISCTMNSNNTFDITGEVSFYKFNDFSSLSEYCKANMTTKYFSIKNVTAIPSSYQIDSYTTLGFSGGVFSIKYSERDNYSSYFYNMYNSSVTYGNKD